MADRTWRGATTALLLMAAISLVVRIHNVVLYPGLRAPDGFGHFTYIWHLASTGTIPLATSGWSFFHPPLYYAWMAWVWNTLDSLDPSIRLRIGTGVIAAAGLTHVAVAFALVRRRYPGRTLLHVAAAGFLLFLPIQLYTAGYLGNEALNAILCSLALLATLRLFERPSARRALVLGLLLGLAMLTKFTALAMVGGVFASIGLRMLLRRSIRRDLPLATLAGAVALVVCGWFYLRNVEVYGTPFRMSRDTLAVSRIENIQAQGKRDLPEFLLFDPMIIVRPQWPRGLPSTEVPSHFERSALRESVWTGMFAHTFFDGAGGQVLPLVTVDNQARRAGQILLLLGLIPTALVLAGIVATMARLYRSGWNDIDGTVLVCFVASVALFVYGARAVPMHAAIKGTYLMAASAMFAYWFAAGLDVLDRRLPRFLRNLALGDCLALAVASVIVFTQGAFVCRDYRERTLKSDLLLNIQGIVAYAGGDREQARHYFERSAVTELHLAQENLAAMALEEGQVLESVYRMRLAALLQPERSFGTPEDRAAFDRNTQAEYRNSIGAAYYELGWIDQAERSLREALVMAPSIPETSYDLGILELTRSLDAPDADTRRQFERDAARSFARAHELDPGFPEAARLASGAASGDGSCRRFPPMKAAQCWTPLRNYPVETATGDLHASALRRRRHITRLRDDLHEALERRDCLPEG